MPFVSIFSHFASAKDRVMVATSFLLSNVYCKGGHPLRLCASSAVMASSTRGANVVGTSDIQVG